MAPRPTRSGRHQPARLSHYAGAHLSDLENLERSGFVRPGHGAGFDPVPEGFLLEATLRCEGGVVIEVRKLARIVVEDLDDPEVETAWYSYNVALEGHGAVFRYDSPDASGGANHHAHHHVHRYDVLDGDTDGTIEPVNGEENIPHLGDVVREARDWYHEQFARLQALGLA